MFMHSVRNKGVKNRLAEVLLHVMLKAALCELHVTLKVVLKEADFTVYLHNARRSKTQIKWQACNANRHFDRFPRKHEDEIL